MVLFSLFFFGFFFAFVGSITPSMLNMTALKISLEKGKDAANKYAVGVAFIVVLQAIIAVVLTRYISENPTILDTLEKAGIIIFIFLSFYFYRESKKEKRDIETTISKKETPFLKGITLSMLNMFAIPFFCGIVIFLDTFKLFSFEIIAVSFFTFGCFIGTFYILFLYGKFAKRIQKITGKLTKDINLVLSILTGFVAVFTIIKSFI